jgi:hypothetical protein
MGKNNEHWTNLGCIFAFALIQGKSVLLYNDSSSTKECENLSVATDEFSDKRTHFPNNGRIFRPRKILPFFGKSFRWNGQVFRESEIISVGAIIDIGNREAGNSYAPALKTVNPSTGASAVTVTMRGRCPDNREATLTQTVLEIATRGRLTNSPIISSKTMFLLTFPRQPNGLLPGSAEMLRVPSTQRQLESGLFGVKSKNLADKIDHES